MAAIGLALAMAAAVFAGCSPKKATDGESDRRGTAVTVPTESADIVNSPAAATKEDCH